MTAAPRDPALSVVVVTRDDYRTLGPIVGSLERQTLAGRIELLVVAPAAAAVTIPANVAGLFHSARVIPVGPVISRARAAASGVHAARAPIVALTENHCFPEPDWADRVLAAHRGDWVAVGPAVANANPDSLVSQALHAFGYGGFPRSRPAGGADELPLHNSSYRKDALPADLEELEDLLADEARLQATLIARGLALRFDPGPVKWHVNEATWDRLVGLCYLSGRRYGGARARGWPWPRRLLYAAAAPLLSLPVARSVWRKVRSDEGADRGLALAAVVWAIGLCHAAGEAASYLRGPRDLFPFLENEEFLILERLNGRPVGRPEIASLLARLDDAGGRSARV